MQTKTKNLSQTKKNSGLSFRVRETERELSLRKKTGSRFEKERERQGLGLGFFFFSSAVPPSLLSPLNQAFNQSLIFSPFLFPFLSFAPSLCNRASPSLSWRSPRRERDGRLRVRPARGRPGGRSGRRSIGGGPGRRSLDGSDDDDNDGFGWRSI